MIDCVPSGTLFLPYTGTYTLYAVHEENNRAIIKEFKIGFIV
jgi:hypothetical protein